MALYDDYFTNGDKPFAENLNDALLLSNVFDMTVGVEFPRMFSNSTWVSTTSPRKCGVAILTLKEGLPSGVSVSTSDNKSVLTGTGTVKLTFYPNFNSFGKFKSIDWTNTGTVKVNLKTSTGTTIASDISKGEIENQSSELRTLQEIVIEIVMTNATLKSFEVVMENKQQTRYGADVGITDVTGLDDTISAIQSKDTTQDGRLDIIEAKDVTQDGRLTAIESKDITQDGRLDSLESSAGNVMNINLSADKHIVKIVRVGTAEKVQFTATATDINGNPINNQSLTLLKDGETVSSQTTDSNGEAVWEISITTGGIYDFSVNDEHTLVSTYGFEEIKSTTNSRYVLWADKCRKVAMLEVTLDEVSISSGDSEYELSGFIPSQYRPPLSGNVFSHLGRNYNLICYIWGSGGTVGISNQSSSTLTAVSSHTLIQWSYE